MDIQVFTILICKCVSLNFADAFFNSGKADQLTEFFLTFTDIDKRCSDRHKKAKLIEADQFFINLKDLIFRLRVKQRF